MSTLNLPTDKIKVRFSEIEIECENSEVSKNKEVRKVEIEKETVEQKLDLFKEDLERCDKKRQEWLKMYEQEHKQNLSLLSKNNAMKVEIEEFKSARARLELDFRCQDKMHSKIVENARINGEKNEELVRENEKLRIRLAGSQDAFKNLEVHHRDFIVEIKKRHKKDLSNVDNIYNMYGMEYEDLYSKTHKIYEDHKDDAHIINLLRDTVKSQKVEIVKATDEGNQLVEKFNYYRTHFNEIRDENEKLETEAARKNSEIKELTSK